MREGSARQFQDGITESDERLDRRQQAGKIEHGERPPTPTDAPQDEHAAELHPAVGDLISLGKSRGWLSYEELNNNVPTRWSTPTRLDELMVLMDRHGIQMVDQSQLRARLHRERLARGEEDGVLNQPAPALFMRGQCYDRRGGGERRAEAAALQQKLSEQIQSHAGDEDTTD